MNKSPENVVNGLIHYADAEVMNKLPTTGKWVMGTAIGIASTKIHHVVDTLKENTVVQMLDIVDEDGNIDVDTIIYYMRESAEKYGSVTMEVPLVGRLTFSAADLDSLRNYIG